MPIDKNTFDQAIYGVQANPDDNQAKNHAGDMITQLVNMIIHTNKFTYNQDIIQEVVLKSWKIVNKATKSKGSPFNFFWTCMFRDLMKEYKKEQKYKSRNFLFSNLKYEPDPIDPTLSKENHITALENSIEVEDDSKKN